MPFSKWYFVAASRTGGLGATRAFEGAEAAAIMAAKKRRSNTHSSIVRLLNSMAENALSRPEADLPLSTNPGP